MLLNVVDLNLSVMPVNAGAPFPELPPRTHVMKAEGR